MNSNWVWISGRLRNLSFIENIRIRDETTVSFTDSNGVEKYHVANNSVKEAEKLIAYIERQLVAEL